MNIYELYGRQAEQFNELLAAWKQVLSVVTDVSEGRIQPSQLVVTENGVEVKPVAPLSFRGADTAVSG